MGKESENNWPEFDIRNWKDIPIISRRIATEEEARKGIAVFCLKNTGEEHKFFEIELPKMAYLIDEETNEKELIVAIQAEESKHGIVIGYRNPKGGNGACLLNELDFLNDIEIENVTKKASS